MGPRYLSIDIRALYGSRSIHAVSWEATGLWVQILCSYALQPDGGHARYRGELLSESTVHQLVNGNRRRVRRLLTELKNAELIRIDENGALVFDQDFLRKAHSSNRRPISKARRQFIFERDGFSCRECGSGENLEIDHVVSIADGGDDFDENLQTLCSPCNRRKGGGESRRSRCA